MMQIILGIGHKARHGKDSFARAIEDYYGNLNAAMLSHSHGMPVVVQRLAFADALRAEVNQWLSTPSGQSWMKGSPFAIVTDTIHIPDWVVPDPHPEFTPQTPLGKHPKLLQWWGTEYRRAQDQDYWAKKGIERISPTANIVLFTDMRFLNEAWGIIQKGGYTVNVTRLKSDGEPFVDPSRPADHVSETALDGFNYDFYVRSKDAVLTGEFAVTLVHFLLARAKKGK